MTPFLQKYRKQLVFLLCGGTAFLTDFLVFSLLAWLGLPILLMARPLSIAAATVVGWLLHRTFTFAYLKPPSFKEFLSYCASAGFSSLLNYGVFALLVYMGVPPSIALVIGSAVAMVTAYAGMSLIFRTHS